jgi:hypothetical protein
MDTALYFAVTKEDKTLEVSIDSLKYGRYKAIDQEVFIGSVIVILYELDSVSEQNVNIQIETSPVIHP